MDSTDVRQNGEMGKGGMSCFRYSSHGHCEKLQCKGLRLHLMSAAESCKTRD